MSKHDWIAVLDFGSQYSQLIAPGVCGELHVYSEIIRFDTSARGHRAEEAGRDRSVGWAGERSRRARPVVRSGDLWAGHPHSRDLLRDADDRASPGRNGQARQVPRVRERRGPRSGARRAFRGLPSDLDVWMSHGDQVEKVPPGFHALATTATCPWRPMCDPARRIYGFSSILRWCIRPRHGDSQRFVFDVCRCKSGLADGGVYRGDRRGDS